MAYHKLKFKIFSLIIATCLLSCTESVPNSQTDAIEKSLNYERNSSLQARLFGAWSSPQLLSSEISTDTNVNGVTANLGGNRNGFLAFSVEKNIPTGIDNRTSFYSKDINANWISNSPVGPTATQNEQPIISIDQITGDTLAAWIDNESIYTSRFLPDFGWEQPTLHGVGNKIHMSKNQQGKVLLLWYLTGTIDTALNASYFDGSNAQAGWTNPAILTRFAKLTVTPVSPVRLVNGSYLFSWIEDVNGVSSMHSARLDPILGWSSPLAIPDPNISQINRMELAIDIHSNTVKLFYQTNWNTPEYGLYIADYYYNIGFDELWFSAVLFVDPTINANPSRFLDFQVSYTDATSNNISLLWVSDLDDSINQYHVIQMSQFDMADGWSKPAVISSPLFRYPLSSPPLDDSFNTIRSLQMDKNIHGQIQAAWIETTSSAQQIKTSATQSTGEWGSAEIIDTVSSDKKILNQISIASNINNESQILWVREDVVNFKYDFFTSEYVGTDNGGLPAPFNPTTPKPATHINSTDICEACHTATGTLVIVDHFEVVGTCASCHNGAIANGKNPGHMNTSDGCDACHSTSKWVPAITVDHTQVVGTCIDCHNGVVVSGKSRAHVSTTDICEACHTTVTWLPAIVVDHNEVFGSCGSCHNNIIAIGRSPSHLLSTDICEACHSITAWVPAITVDHSEVIGICGTCHNGILATGQHTAHIATTTACEACHSTMTFVPSTVDHNEVIGFCESCHSPSPLSHQMVGANDACDACHSTSTWFAPTSPLPVGNGSGNGTPPISVPSTLPEKSLTHILTSEDCLQCHVQGTILPIRLSHADTLGTCESCHGVSARGKSLIHLLTSDVCAACHTHRMWVPAALVNHTEIPGACQSCHDTVIAKGKSLMHIASDDNCQACHETRAWLPTLPVP